MLCLGMVYLDYYHQYTAVYETVVSGKFKFLSSQGRKFFDGDPPQVQATVMGVPDVVSGLFRDISRYAALAAPTGRALIVSSIRGTPG
eukprot:SAG31_NODE_957_length_10768_cov_3.322992_10_plen_88_part_00